MKKSILFLVLVLITVYNFAQNSNAPWIKELEKKSPQKEYSLKEATKAFNNYWEIHKNRKNNKGSGYKIFKRWENRWKTSLDERGMIPKPKYLWEAWKEKQKIQQQKTTNTSNWQNIGPYTQTSKTGQGRVNTFIVDPNNPLIFYVGAPSGGLWKSIDAGNTWSPLTDYLPQIGVSGIAIDYNNSNIIYIATGDDDTYDSYSIGILKSIDGGLTWNTTGLQFFDEFTNSNEIYIHPTNSNILWVATSNGVYKSIDAGTTWNIVLNGNIRDLKVKPNDPSTLYAVSSNNFYKSTDGGTTFNQVLSGLPSSSGRLAIDVTQANSAIVYLLSANIYNQFQGVYKSTDSGTTFTQMAENYNIFEESYQAWYDMALTVSDTDENTIYVGVLDIWKSVNGGDNFTQITDWEITNSPSYTHADIHFLRFFNGVLFCGSDGGIYKSTDNGNTFNDLSEGLSISQVYRIAASKQSVANIAGGLQDNGSFGLHNSSWNRYHGGDGMDCAINPYNPLAYYGFSQNGSYLGISKNGGITGYYINTVQAGDWVTPMAMNKRAELYVGFSDLYKLQNDETFIQVNTSSFISNYISNIKIDPNNDDIIYVSSVTDLYKSVDGGTTFTEIFSDLELITSIEINAQDSNIIYLTTSGNNGNVYKSINGGINFTSINLNLPNIAKNIIVHQPHSLVNDLYIGTDLGVFHINDTMNNWEDFSTDLPNVSIRDLEINSNDNKIIAATYGRGVWTSDIEQPVPLNDVNMISIVNKYNCDSNFSPVINIKNGGTQPINQVNFIYTIDATTYNYNYVGLVNTNNTETITLPEITNLTIGKHNIEVEAIITNDAFSDNNFTLKEFYINRINATPTIVNPFESSNTDSWLVTGSDLWEIGTPTTPILSISNNKGYVTNATGNYPYNASSYLTSPCYDLSQITNPKLKFDMAFSIEEDWDVLYVEYTVDNGESWEVLGTANDPNWYNNNTTSNELTIGKQWSGTVSTFTNYSHELSTLANETNVSFRFSFLSDGYIDDEGVLIDNFVIESTSVAEVNDINFEKFQLYPNPSNGKFIIKRQNNYPMHIVVSDITGKIVYDLSNINEYDFNLDFTELDKGIYFATIQIDNNKKNFKLVKK